MVKINFGSGTFPLDGWINVDLEASNKPDVVVDVGRPLPFAARTDDYIFCEDLIAYLGLDSVRVFLAECRRILKAQGAMRILTPDLAQLARSYCDEPGMLVDLWKRSTGIALATGTACEVVNRAYELAGHFQFDSPTLIALAGEAGFDATRVGYRKSRFGALAALDMRPPTESLSMYHELYPRPDAASR
jgi:hypothetical protein